MKLIRCDICGIECEHPGENCPAFKMRAALTIDIVLSSNTGSSLKKDLCDNCYNELNYAIDVMFKKKHGLGYPPKSGVGLGSGGYGLRLKT